MSTALDSPRLDINKMDKTSLEIVRFDPAYREHFRWLNVAWIGRYFKVEPIDELVLGDPEGQILAKGGEILFAKLGTRVVGTVGLKREGVDTYELTKMAVDERWQARGYGQTLFEAALGLAREKGARRVVLYTQTALASAVTMYRKNGFTEVSGADLSRYSRCDLMMELVLEREVVKK
jgi:GNAT superfamily N-acetyltransferase